MKVEFNGKEIDTKKVFIFGRDIKLVRLFGKKTTSDICQMLGVKSRKTVENWEADRSQPSMLQLVMICLFCNVDPSRFVDLCIQRSLELGEMEAHKDIDISLCAS